MKTRKVYPFSAIVGQEQMKLALILNAINPKIGGVLIRGEKGTAKSTAVRALAALLPEIPVAHGCPYSCDPLDRNRLCDFCRKNAWQRVDHRKIRVVDFPLNATEDRISGGIDFQMAVKTGRPQFQPGLLAKAHRGFLYVDEINLLDDHLVDIILDAAACGENIVEREGISFCHPARFILVGTMNPEEGELRPQLLDRFGLCLEVAAAHDVEERALLMECREAFDSDPAGFAAELQEAEAEIAASIERARKILPAVEVQASMRHFISQLCTESNVAGHRADLVIEQAAIALAAWAGRKIVATEDVKAAAKLALLHRSRHVAPPQPPPPEPDKSSENENKGDEQQSTKDPPAEGANHDQKRGKPSSHAEGASSEQSGENDAASEDNPSQAPVERSVQEKIFEIGETFRMRRITQHKDRLLRRGSGRRSRTRTSQKQGRYVRSTMDMQRNDLALDATLRAAAPYQKRRRKDSHLAVVIRPRDFREKVREKRIGNFFLFIVDASGSMGARGRMRATKGAIMSLLLDAYQKRDRVALVCFRGRDATLMVPPTSSIDLAGKLLKDLPVGGRTPLTAGLLKGSEVLRNCFLKDPSAQPIVLVLTDGRGNVAINEASSPIREALLAAGRMAGDQRSKFIVVDTEQNGLVRFGLSAEIAAALHAQYFKIDNLKSENLL
ncbi:MAG: putative cobaltochelatase, partial [Desulforhabdus sp.]|nr:putative cobaltochelatase [Desulforhabdus sp.]